MKAKRKKKNYKMTWKDFWYIYLCGFVFALIGYLNGYFDR